MPNWTDDLVQGTSAASAGDDELRSFMTQLASGLSPSFDWPGSGGGATADAGKSKLGNARCAHSNAVTGGYPDGYLRLNPTRAALMHIGTPPTVVGHSSMVDYNLGAIVPGFQRWVRQSGNSQLYSSGSSFGTINISFTSTYDATPVFLQVVTDTGGSGVSVGPLMNVSSVSAGGFSSSWSFLGPLEGSPRIHWESFGSITV